jgi:hypothetical protein
VPGRKIDEGKDRSRPAFFVATGEGEEVGEFLGLRAA